MFTKLNMNKIKFNSINNGESFLNKICITCPPRPDIKPLETPPITNLPKLLLEPLNYNKEELHSSCNIVSNNNNVIEPANRKIISINVKYSNPK